MTSSLGSKYTIDKKGCWNWNKCLNDRGYGITSYKGKIWKAHRLSYVLYHNKNINSKIFICHSCDNPSCINPDHLFEGNMDINMKDMVSKNRSAKGISHGMNKLSEQDVKKIKESYIPRIYSQRMLARDFHVDQSLISRIINSKNWRHV